MLRFIGDNNIPTAISILTNLIGVLCFAYPLAFYTRLGVYGLPIGLGCGLLLGAAGLTPRFLTKTSAEALEKASVTPPEQQTENQSYLSSCWAGFYSKVESIKNSIYEKSSGWHFWKSEPEGEKKPLLPKAEQILPQEILTEAVLQ